MIHRPPIRYRSPASSVVGGQCSASATGNHRRLPSASFTATVSRSVIPHPHSAAFGSLPAARRPSGSGRRSAWSPGRHFRASRCTGWLRFCHIFPPSRVSPVFLRVVQVFWRPNGQLTRKSDISELMKQTFEAGLNAPSGPDVDPSTADDRNRFPVTTIDR